MKPKSQKRHTRPGDPIKWGKFLDVQGKLVTHIEEGLSYSVCCDLVGVARSTFYSYLERGEKEPSGPYGAFVKAVAAANAKACRELHIAVKRVDPKWLLERRFPNYYPSPKHIQEISGPDGSPIQSEGKFELTISCNGPIPDYPIVDSRTMQPVTGGNGTNGDHDNTRQN